MKAASLLIQIFLALGSWILMLIIGDLAFPAMVDAATKDFKFEFYAYTIAVFACGTVFGFLCGWVCKAYMRNKRESEAIASKEAEISSLLEEQEIGSIDDFSDQELRFILSALNDGTSVSGLLIRSSDIVGMTLIDKGVFRIIEESQIGYEKGILRKSLRCPMSREWRRWAIRHRDEIEEKLNRGTARALKGDGR